jgi:hypothetical protein
VTRQRRNLFAAAAASAGAAALWVATRGPLDSKGVPPSDGYTRVAAVVHVHTSFSDGGGTPEEVVAAARETGLGVLGLSDHNNLDAKPIEGYRDGVLVLVGSEISTIAGHILALGIPDPAFRFSGDPQDAFDDVRVLGGIAFAAHPINPRADFLFGAWDEPGPWGLEVMNGDSQWREAGLVSLARTAGLYLLNSRYALLGSLSPPVATLERWDAMLRRRDVPGIVGADAHSRVPITRRRGLRFPSYASLFRLVRNHLLLDRPLSGEFARDQRVVLDALAGGRSYVGVDALAPAGEISFVAEGPGGRWTMGETAPLGAELRLRAGGRAPEGTRLRLLKDGVTLREAQDHLDEAVPGPGVYRLEAYVPGTTLPWVITNPIYVFDDAARAARQAAASWRSPAAAPPAVESVDEFEGTTRFAPEFDASSNVDAAFVAAGEGPDGSAAARLVFRLGEPGPGRPFVWCALVNREARDLQGRKGLVFSIRGDGVYRLWVQVRDANPASADDGTEWWFASVRTSTEWARVALRFDRLRSLNPKTDGRLDLDKVRGLVFVLDQGAVKPGTHGTIWVDDIGLY